MGPDHEVRLSRPALLILATLLEHPQEELSGADLRRQTGVATGTLYPILLRLEDAGWLTSRWEELNPREAGRPRRRLYSMTGLGVRKAQAAVTLVPRSTRELSWT